MKKRSILVALLLAASLSLGAAPALAGADHSEGGYLALGDSVPFGYSPLVSPADSFNPANFDGYPEAFARDEERSVTNASCPGETSGSLISRSTRDNSCGTFRSHFPLHVAYSGAQLAFAVGYLQSHRDTRVISMTIGANDLFLLQKDCALIDPAPNKVLACTIAGLPAMLTKLGQNLATIYGTIRAAGYTGRFAAVTYYSLDYADPAQVSVISAIDNVIASVTRQFGGVVADGFAAFQQPAAAFGGNSCAAGLLIVTSASPLKCDVHPSPKGRDALAEALEEAL